MNKRHIDLCVRQTIADEWISDIQDKVKDTDELSHLSSEYINIMENVSRVILGEQTQPNTQSGDDDDEPIQSSEPYVFERRLAGGFAIKGDESYFVPERIVRNYQFKHGDSIMVYPNANGEGAHQYEKINDNSNQTKKLAPCELNDYDYALVKQIPELNNKFVAYAYYDNEKGYQSITPSMSIHGGDVEKFHLEDGDLVHIAYYNDSTLARVRWKYNQDEIIPTPKPKKSSEYKDKVISNVEFDQDFENITVAVIGYDTADKNYEDEVTKRGGSLIHTSSVDSGVIENKVKQADIVVMPTHYMGHGQMDITKSICKDLNKPLVIINKGGRSYFTYRIKEVVSQLNKDDE